MKQTWYQIITFLNQGLGHDIRIFQDLYLVFSEMRFRGLLKYLKINSLPVKASFPHLPVEERLPPLQ